ncbi:MAG: hypothetical protein K2O97_02330, partial [Acetatifactor sp.]|nr:hypothetical protein [Acetatifactor sp.]
MSCLGNLLWFLFGGFISGLSWCLAGILWCITIIGTPVGAGRCSSPVRSFLVEYGSELRQVAYV